MRRTVAILLFDEVEVLDFAGPFEVFAVTDELAEQQLFRKAKACGGMTPRVEDFSLMSRLSSSVTRASRLSRAVRVN